MLCPGVFTKSTPCMKTLTRHVEGTIPCSLHTPLHLCLHKFYIRSESARHVMKDIKDEQCMNFSTFAWSKKRRVVTLLLGKVCIVITLYKIIKNCHSSPINARCRSSWTTNIHHCNLQWNLSASQIGYPVYFYLIIILIIMNLPHWIIKSSKRSS